jgi:hypothetical protein
MATSTKTVWLWVVLILIALGSFLLVLNLLSDSTSEKNSITANFAQDLSSSESNERSDFRTDSEGSTGDGMDDFGACEEDAHLYCAGFYSAEWADWAEENGYTSASWKLGLVDCLGQNREQLISACINSLDRRSDLNEDVNTLCATDRNLYCQGVEPKPGSEPQIDCLKEHYEELSETCTEALDAHEAAKPL